MKLHRWEDVKECLAAIRDLFTPPTAECHLVREPEKDDGAARTWRCSTCLIYVVGFADAPPYVPNCVGAPMMEPATRTLNFQLGEEWHSTDDGRSWTRSQYVGGMSNLYAEVVCIDSRNHQVTLAVKAFGSKTETP